MSNLVNTGSNNMADHNSYLRYKRDTRHLTYWIIHASNSIIKAQSSQIRDAGIEAPNFSGQIKVSEFVPLSTLIAKHISPILPAIYRFVSVGDTGKNDSIFCFSAIRLEAT